MSGLLKALLALVLLGVPLIVLTAMPRFFELAGSVPSTENRPAASPTAAFRLAETPTSTTRARFGALEETPPPTLAPPRTTATPVATPRPAPTGERIIIGNTGGVGAVLRSDPVTGQPVAALREQQVLDVLERRTVDGRGDWVHVRTADGVEGWVTGVVALPVSAQNH